MPNLFTWLRPLTARPPGPPYYSATYTPAAGLPMARGVGDVEGSAARLRRRRAVLL